MVSGRKLHAILRPSLKGHSFVCVTVIGLKSPDIFTLVIQVYIIRACSAGWLTEMIYD